MSNAKAAGASSSLRLNIRKIEKIVGSGTTKSRFPRKDFDRALDALIAKAYREGFKKAHRYLCNLDISGSVPAKISTKGKTPTINASKQKVKLKSVYKV